ncbi:amino acid ABC transporter substrate-binding protein [Variovorax sp. LjRoot178]|uniref:amino acid ABC transporter substrate-binding protein n=1 Tax=Variovorax sp. LjRoot178 TaxID=3342277 RepID=UPI003ECDEF69
MKKAILAIVAAACACAAQADTLQKIRETGVVRMGVRESSGALSYTTGYGKYVGFHIDLCHRALADIQQQLGLPQLDIKYAPVSSSNRIPLLQNGTIDIECGSTTNNAARQQQVAFALTTFVEEVRMAVKASSGIQSINQLSGRGVATTTGTTSVQLLRKHEKAAGVDFQEIFGKDHTDSMLNLDSGRADAFVMDSQVLAGNIAKARNPADYKIVGEVLGVEPIAIMLRKDDPAFKQSIDNTLRGMMKSGEIAQLYDKWFMKPIPPAGAIVNLPASEATKAVWAIPNDKPAEEFTLTSAGARK